MSAWIIFAALAAIVVAAPRYGADTRNTDSWTAGRERQSSPRRAPTLVADLGALARAVAVRVTRSDTVTAPIRPRVR